MNPKIKTPQSTATNSVVKRMLAEKSEIRLREDGIFHIDLKLNSLVDIEIARALFEEVKKIGGMQKRKYLYTVSEFLVPDRAVCAFMASEERWSYTAADAFVLHSVEQRVVAQIYLAFDRPQIPSKFFCSFDNALDWLNKLDQ